MFWPSFNGALAPAIQQHRVVVNTVLALSASCVSAFFTDAFMRKKRGKFDMVRQLRHRFGTVSQNNTYFLGYIAPHTRRVICPTWCPYLSDADYRLAI